MVTEDTKNIVDKTRICGIHVEKIATGTMMGRTRKHTYMLKALSLLLHQGMKQ